MSKRLQRQAPPGGRMYTTRAAFPLTWRERWRALLGGEVNVTVRLHVQPGASDIPTQVVHSVNSKPVLRWPWRAQA